MLQVNVILFLLTCSLASAAVVKLPEVTGTPTPHEGTTGETGPRTTTSPQLWELRRRQEFTTKTLIAAPDNTCGYFNGSSKLPWGCSTGNCVFATPSPTFTSYYTIPSFNNTLSYTQIGAQTVGSVLCCDPKTGCPSSPAPTACVDFGRNNYNKTCTGSCPGDSMTLKCTSGIYRYCNTILFTAPASISALFCNYFSTYAILPAETAYAGQTNHSFTPTAAPFALSSLPATTSHPTTLRTNATASTTPTAAPKAKISRGPIVGGVLGGLALIALISGAVFVMRRRRRGGVEKDKGSSETTASTPPKVEIPVVQVAAVESEKPPARSAARHGEGGNRAGRSSKGKGVSRKRG